MNSQSNLKWGIGPQTALRHLHFHIALRENLRSMTFLIVFDKSILPVPVFHKDVSNDDVSLIWTQALVVNDTYYTARSVRHCLGYFLWQPLHS